MTIEFDESTDLKVFEDSLSRVIADWQPLGTRPGTWSCDHDQLLFKELESVGWDGIEHTDFLVAGAFVLGRSAAPVSMLDVATLGGVLEVDGQARYAPASSIAVVPRARDLWRHDLEGLEARVPSLDSFGTVKVKDDPLRRLEDGHARWRAWQAATLAYCAGLVRGALEIAFAHARERVQFGRPLAALPVVQQRLADLALLRDGLELSARAVGSYEDLGPSLVWACREIQVATGSAQQMCGALGFTIEFPIHRYHLRAKALAVWTFEALRSYEAS